MGKWRPQEGSECLGRGMLLMEDVENGNQLIRLEKSWNVERGIYWLSWGCTEVQGSCCPQVAEPEPRTKGPPRALLPLDKGENGIC